jgi:hypothetical protein
MTLGQGKKTGFSRSGRDRCAHGRAVLLENSQNFSPKLVAHTKPITGLHSRRTSGSPNNHFETDTP